MLNDRLRETERQTRKKRIGPTREETKDNRYNTRDKKQIQQIKRQIQRKRDKKHRRRETETKRRGETDTGPEWEERKDETFLECRKRIENDK